MQTMVPLYGFGGVPYSAVRKAAPRNLLDNSDFRNPVNQRGLTSYSNAKYTIDRWKWTYAVATRTTTVNSGSITIQNGSANAGYFGQIFEKTANNVHHTVAVKVGGQIYTGIISWGGVSSGVQLVDDCSIYGEDTREALFFIVPSGKTLQNIEWVSLYEGEYTAETLPEYQPKGYGAELAECQRYYQIRSVNNIAAVDMRPTMRLSNPTTTSVAGGYSYSADL